MRSCSASAFSTFRFARSVMIIPIRVNAPLYHRPFGTVGLIAANVATFCLVPLSPDDPYWLSLGDGLRPLQWLTHMFLHGDVGHLLGNMVFLWCFGLIVEGKIGWWRFLSIYLVIGAAVGAVIQFVMLFSEPGAALGASAAIFGLMAIALVWAPQNTIEFVVVFRYRGFHLDASMMMVGFFYIFVNYLLAVMLGWRMSGAVAHLLGAALGTTVGFSLLVRGWVDCEGFDVISIVRGNEGEADLQEPLIADSAETLMQRRKLMQQRIEDGRLQVAVFIRDGNVDAALRLFAKLREMDSRLELKEEELCGIVHCLLRNKHDQQAWPLVDQYVKRFPSGDAAINIYAARMELLRYKRPQLTLKILKRVDPSSLSLAQREYYHSLVDRATFMLADNDDVSAARAGAASQSI